MVVGLVNTGLMTLIQAVGVTFGANIGTTITGQLVAFRLTDAALPMIGLGFTLSFFGKRRVPKRIGEVLLGLGMIFLGMKLMAQYLTPVVRQPWAAEVLTRFSRQPLLGVLAGAILTGIVQSSSATTGMIIAMAGDGAIDLAAAMPLILGANVGTCVTALLASIGSSVMARRAAVVHLLFNVIGVVLFLPFVGGFEAVVRNLGSDVTRQIANAHTAFNITTTLALLPLAGLLTRLASVVVRGRVETVPAGPRSLDVRFLNTPALAISQARKEAINMAGYVLESVAMVFEGVLKNDAAATSHVLPREQVTNNYERAITDYLTALSAQELAEEDSRRVANVLLAVKDLERIGDHAENLARLATEKAEDSVHFSAQAEDEIRTMYGLVERAMETAQAALESGGPGPAEALAGFEDELDTMETTLRDAHIRRLTEHACSPAAGIIFLDVASHFERIGDHAANIGRLMGTEALG